MDTDAIKLIANLVFAVVIILMAAISLLAMYVLIRYGRTRSITVLASMVFAGVFILGALGAYVTLQNIF